MGRGVCNFPYAFFFLGRSKTLKKVTYGIQVISFTSFAVIMMKQLGVSLYLGVGSAIKVRRWEGGCNLFQFFYILNRHFEKYLYTMKLTSKNALSCFYKCNSACGIFMQLSSMFITLLFFTARSVPCFIFKILIVYFGIMNFFIKLLLFSQKSKI